MLKNNEVQVVEEVAEATAKSGLTSTQKKVVGIVVLSVLTAGLVALGYGIYKGVNSRKAAKASNESTPEEAHE